MKNFYLAIILTFLFAGAQAQTVLVVDEVESTTGWGSSNTGSFALVGSATGVTSGSQSLQTTVSAGGGVLFFQKSISPAINITSITAISSAYLAFSLYVSDVSQLQKNGRIEISSNSGPDAKNLRWMIPSNLQNGWNDVKLYLADAIPADNPALPIDLTAVNFFRIFDGLNAGITVGIDYVRFSHDPIPADEVGLTFFDKCEANTGWIIDPITVDNADFKQGAASLSQTGTDGLRFRKERAALNVSGNNFFGLWLYVSDVSKFTGGDAPQVRIASAGNGDDATTTLSWNLPSLVNGWNNLVLPMTGAGVIDGGSFNPATVVAFRFTGASSAAITAKLDKIAFAATADLLPVSFTSFSATAVDNRAKLQWETKSESENARFLVQRSVNGSSFATIGEVAAKGAGVYTFSDENPANENNYYRLVQVDLNGTENTYDKVVSLNFKIEKEAPLSVYPNPSNGDFNILYNATGKSGKISISLSDSNGRTVKSEEVSSEDINGFRLQTGSSLKAGVYILRVTNESVKVIIK